MGPLTAAVRSPLSTLSVAWVLALAAPIAFAGDESPWASYAPGSNVAATVAKGKIIRGKIDPRTSPTHLWLTVEAEGISISSCIARTEVITVAPAAEVTLPPRLAVMNNVSSVPASPSTHPTVKSLQAFAHYANWDNDPQPDGLTLLLVPTDAIGQVVPVTGSVSAQLQVYRGPWPGTGGAFREAESWGQQIASRSFTSQGIVLKLPFQKLNFPADQVQFPLGVLHLRLGVPGQGTFDAVIQDVQFRPQAYTLDLQSGSQVRQATIRP